MKLGEIAKKLLRKEENPDRQPPRSKSLLGFDLLYQLSYMSVIATAGVPRKQIFEHAAEVPCGFAGYFRKIESMYRRLRYDYAKACRIVGESAEEDEIKGLLLRFSTSLLSGEPESDFLVREAEAQAAAYNNDYGRKLETLKLWTDAYVSLILSAVLIIIMGIISTMIWKIETAVILGMVMVAILTTVLGVWIIYLISPKEVMVLRWAGTKEQKLVRKIFRLVIPASVILLALLLLVGANLGWMMLAIAALIFPVGWISALDDKKVVKRDAEVGSFLGSLGGVSAAIGTTVRDALARLDLDAIHTLRWEVKRLHTRLLSGIRGKLCWQKFIDETGSELANRSVSMFYDAIDLGGDAQQAGYHASIFANKIAQLRAQRKTVATPFRWLCIAMHACVVALLIFITEVMGIFGELLATAGSDMPEISGAPSMSSLSTFNLEGLEIMQSMVMPLVIVFTVSNALAPSIVDGGSRYKILYNLGITALVTALSLISLPTLAALLFKSVEV